MKEFIIVERRHRQAFVDIINAKLLLGFELHGPPFIAKNEAYEFDCYHQAMVKTTHTNDCVCVCEEPKEPCGEAIAKSCLPLR